MLETVHHEWDPEFGNPSLSGFPATSGAGSAMVASAAKCLVYLFSEETMIRFRKFLPIVAVLVGAGMFAAPTQAYADFELRYSTNGGSTFTTVIDNGVGDLNSNTGNILVNVDGLNITGHGTAASNVQSTLVDLGVSGNYSAGAALDLIVQVWLNPTLTAPPPQTLTYQFTGSVLPTGSGSIAETTWINNNSTPFDTATGNVLKVGPLPPTSPAAQTAQFSATSPYSITVGTEVTIAAGAGLVSISSDNNNQITAAPAPAGLLLMLSGAPILGLACFLRRKFGRKDQQPSMV